MFSTMHIVQVLLFTTALRILMTFPVSSFLGTFPSLWEDTLNIFSSSFSVPLSSSISYDAKPILFHCCWFLFVCSIFFLLFFLHRKYCPNTDTWSWLKSVLVLSLWALLDQSMWLFFPQNKLVLIVPCSLCEPILFLARVNQGFGSYSLKPFSCRVCSDG